MFSHMDFEMLTRRALLKQLAPPPVELPAAERIVVPPHLLRTPV